MAPGYALPCVYKALCSFKGYIRHCLKGRHKDVCSILLCCVNGGPFSSSGRATDL